MFEGIDLYSYLNFIFGLGRKCGGLEKELDISNKALRKEQETGVYYQEEIILLNKTLLDHGIQNN